MNEGDIAAGLDFGRSKAILENKSDNPMTDLLLQLTNELIADWRKQLETPNSKGHKPYATGKLAQSLEPLKIAHSQIATTGENHWKYINYGVNGIKVNRGAPTHGKAPKGNLSFYDAIYKWIGDKGIVPEEGMTREQLAGMIVNSVRMKGIEATHFFDKVLTEQRVDEMSQRVSDLIGAAIRTIIIKPK